MCASLRPSMASEIFGRESPLSPSNFGTIVSKNRTHQRHYSDDYSSMLERRVGDVFQKILRARDGPNEAHMDVP